MSRIGDLLIGVVLAVLLAVGGWLGLRHYGAERYQAGYNAAVAAGKEARDSAEVANLAIESGLRAQLLDRDIAAQRKEQEDASNLEAAQRRMRAGTDRMRCPAASTVQPGTQAENRPAAGGPAADGDGQAMVPEVSAAVLGFVADHQRLVQRYARLQWRFEACRAVNARP